MTTTVIAVREDRLGARLCALVNGMRIAEALDARFYFVWPPDDEWSDEINDVDQLFTKQFIDRYLLSETNFGEICDRGTDRRHLPGEVEVLQCGNDDVYICRTPFGAFPLDRLTGVGKAVDLSTIFRERIAFHETVMGSADRLLGPLRADRRAIGIHLRRGDVLQARADYEGRYAPVAFFVEYLRRQPAETACFVFSDDPAAGRALLPHLHDLPITLVDGAGLPLTTLQRAACEFLVMTRMHRLVGTHSAFRETAALFGGAESVDIRDALPADQRLTMLRDCLMAMASSDPEVPITKLCLAIACAAAGNAAEALDAVDWLIGWDPCYWYYPLLKARIEIERGDLAQAEAAIGQAMALAPEEPRVRHLLGVLLARQGHANDAEAEFRAAIAATPNRIAAYRELNQLLIRHGRLAEAEAVIVGALGIKPDHPKLLLQLGLLRLRRGDVPGAMAALWRAATRCYR